MWPQHSDYTHLRYSFFVCLFIFRQMSKSMKIYLPLHHGSVLCGLPSQHVALIVLLLGLLHSAWIIVSCLHDPLPPPHPNPLTLFPTTCPLEHLFSHHWLSACFLDRTEAAPDPGPLRVLVPLRSRSSSGCPPGSLSPSFTCHGAESLP